MDISYECGNYKKSLHHVRRYHCYYVVKDVTNRRIFVYEAVFAM